MMRVRKKKIKQDPNRQLFRDMYVEIAVNAYPFGAMFTCKVCDYWFRGDIDLCAEYFEKGWPRHCDELMTIEKSMEEE